MRRSADSRMVVGLGLVLAAAMLPAVPARADLKIEEEATSLGSTVRRWVYIKGDKRSIVSRAESTGVLYNAGARYGAQVEIARPDKDVIWQLDPRERSYREVSFDKFKTLVQRGRQAPRTAQEQALRSTYQTDTTHIEAVETGATRKIAGQTAHQVMARVIVGARNQYSGNVFNFTFDQEIWLCKDPAIVKEHQAFENAYVETFGTALTLQQSQVAAGEWGDAFITHVRALSDRVRALGGVPLAMTISVTEEAVAQNRNEKSAQRKTLVASLEVKKISLETVADSEFELPVGFINQDTRVAVAGPNAAPMPAPLPTPDDEKLTSGVIAAIGPKNPRAVPPAPAPVAPLIAAAGPTQKLPSVTPPPADTTPPATLADARAMMPPMLPAAPPPTPVVAPRTAPEPIATVAATRSGATPVIVTAQPAPVITNNIPILSGGVLSGGLASGQAPPPPVTIDEPETFKPRRKKK